MEEVEELVENLMFDETDVLDLSFEFAQQAPFSTLLYNRRLADFSDNEFQTALAVLNQALAQNHSVRQVQIDWSFLRILEANEQEALFRCIGQLPQVAGLAITGTTPNVNHQHLAVFHFMRAINASMETLTMDAMGCLKLQDFVFGQQFGAALQRSSTTLRILRLENVVLPQDPNYPALDDFVAGLATSCHALTELHLSISLPRQYRRVSQPLVRTETLALLTRPTILRLHNFGLTAAHALRLLCLPQLVALDLFNNFLLDDSANGMELYRAALRQQTFLKEFRGIDSDAIVERYLLLNACGRAQATAAGGGALTTDYWAAISVAGDLLERRAARNNNKALRVTLDALYAAIREHPPISFMAKRLH